MAFEKMPETSPDAHGIGLGNNNPKLYVNNAALIVGSSPAGLQAAVDLADSGICVHLIESTPFLGNSSVASMPPYMLNARLLEIAKHPRITVWTNTRLDSAEKTVNFFHAKLHQYPRYVDLTKCTACGDCIEVCPVTVPGTDHKAIFLTDGAQPGCAAIDKLGEAPCSHACPGGIHVQGYVALISQGRFQEALDIIRDAIPFPGICGRICIHPCEMNCRRKDVDTPVSIRLLKRFVADWALNESEEKPKTKIPISENARRVAIVGSGPAGMTVADGLARLGHRVTVFERLPAIGGMMAMGIPAYRLPREVITREYRRIQDLGVEIRLNTTIGSGGDHTIDDFFRTGYHAVCLTIGAHKGLTLQIPGENSPGVVQGIELLKTISLSQQIADSSYETALQQMLRGGATTRAVVLGGGNTAIDAARSLKRMGLKDIRILYRRSRTEMPALPEEIEAAEQEGIIIEFLTAPVVILGNHKTGVKALKCIRMELSDLDESGRRRPVPIPGSEFKIDLELVVLAIGQVPDIKILDQDPDIAVDQDQRIHLEEPGFMTNRSGVFAAGDAVTRDKMSVIEAIGMGKKASAQIDAYLKGQRQEPMVREAASLPVARRELTKQEKTIVPQIPVPTLPAAKRINSYNEVEVGYTKDQAIAEAGRCLVCGPCSQCMACVNVCKPKAIFHDQNENLMEMDFGSILYAGDPAFFTDSPLSNVRGVYQVLPESPLEGSAAASKAMFDLFAGQHPDPVKFESVALDDAGSVRIGVFICNCGDAIASVVDTQALCDQARGFPNVTASHLLNFSCSPEAAETIFNTVSNHQLNRIVLAACACCSLDQACYSCTYQRVRCKRNLGLFENNTAENHDLTKLLSAGNLPPAAFEFVNIREQCAWVHTDDPSAATAKAVAIVAAAVARVCSSAARPVDILPVKPSVLIMGSGRAAQVCRDALNYQRISVLQIQEIPSRIWRGEGRYTASKNGHLYQGVGVALAPGNADEWEQLLAAFGKDSHQLRYKHEKEEIVTRQPGIFLCDPNLGTDTAGAAAAARAAAWLGRISGRTGNVTAMVDPDRCRACSTCIEICEIGAPEITGNAPYRVAWIDPAVCTGCGSCIGRCPSNAITGGASTDAQLDAMIEAILG